MGIDGEKSRPGLPTTWRAFRVGPIAILLADRSAYYAYLSLCERLESQNRLNRRTPLGTGIGTSLGERRKPVAI
jgi:hypothetical protein